MKAKLFPEDQDSSSEEGEPNFLNMVSYLIKYPLPNEYLLQVGADTIRQEFGPTIKIKDEPSEKSDTLEQKSSNTETDEDEGFDRVIEEFKAETIMVAKADYEYPIEKIFAFKQLEEQKHRGSNITRGQDVKEMLELDPQTTKILK